MDLKPRNHVKTIVAVVIGLIVFFVFALLGTYVWAAQYEGKIAPNVSIGPVDVSGMDPAIASQAVRTKIDAILAQGIQVRVGQETKTLTLATLISGDLIEDIEYALDPAIEQAQKVQRSWFLLESLIQKTSIPLEVTVIEENVKQNMYRLFPETETLSQNAKFVFTFAPSDWTAEVVPASPGREFQWEPFFDALRLQLSTLNVSVIDLHVMATAPAVTEAMAREQLNKFSELVNAAPFTFTYTDEHNKRFAFPLALPVFAQMIIPTSQGEPKVDEEKFDAFLSTIALKLEHPAQNARIEIENGRVIEFVQSANGLRLDRKATSEQFLGGLKDGSGDSNHKLILNVEEPTVKIGDVNDLGIDQILGTGTSSYRGSPANRRKNIQNGVRLLNGLLIPPGETFSLINALKPFEIENGYLPELVIKGNEIIPELGGGLCQIGTTTFRASMNSGLNITERRNHSIVVSYYNDPANNNPGTDATIYEPAPDFKFLNDTGRYILFQAENLLETQELRFTLWGTSDGRKGSYSPPVVSQWIPVGETQNIETTDLEPGKEKCQEAHIGADASFDYTVVSPDGTMKTTTFASHYRPLPRICLIGSLTPPLDDSITPSLSSDLSTENLAEEKFVE